MITKLKPLTIADWDAMPAEEGYRYELIEGELFVSYSPGLTHQIVLTELIYLIGSFLKANPIGTIVSIPAVVLSNFSGVTPDLVFFSHEQSDTIVKDDRLYGPPALVVEILSPDPADVRRDRVAKLQLYAKHGVPEYWIIDPRIMTLERYVDQGSSLILLETLRYEDTLSTTALPGFSCQMSEIFSQF